MVSFVRCPETMWEIMIFVGDVPKIIGPIIIFSVNRDSIKSQNNFNLTHFSPANATIKILYDIPKAS